ncbi:MAG: ATP-binding protein [Proteobacteria bacterium]|nr:ATP-binding protein [Pseudomonadota bacterium]
MIERTLDLTKVLAQRSAFLFGARQTGKSTLLRSQFPEARFVDLLAADTFRQLSAAPESLRQSLTDADRIIVIDEIQKLPSLLDEVHLLIERNKSLRFILTGSSARKLRRGGANLLAGRAITYNLFPLTFAEVGQAKLSEKLSIGGLPSVLSSERPWEDLREYVGTYLQEEIRAEALTRSIESFSRFLTVAGLANGRQLNFTKIGADAQVPPRTIQEFFSVLEDTLIGFQLPSYRKALSRKAVATSKFYFFDIGVAHALQGIRHIAPGTVAYGDAVEHLVATELRAFLSYTRSEQPLAYWRTTSKFEVDFLIGDSIAVEVKATGRVASSDIRSLLALSEDLTLRRKIIVSSEPEYRKFDSGIEVMPLEQFLLDLWSGAIVATG